MNPDDSLFVWRNVTDYNYYLDEGHRLFVERCPYCNTRLFETESEMSKEDLEAFQEITERNMKDTRFEQIVTLKCSFCGWKKAYFSWSGWNRRMQADAIHAQPKSQHILMEIDDINSTELYMDEIGKYLSQNYDKIDFLSARKFENLVCDILRNHGFNAVLTQQTWDDGVDIILFEGNNNKQTIVEVKKWKNKVGVEIVRQLLGVQLIRNAPTAKLITNGQFTSASKDAAVRNNIQKNGFTIDLVDATDLLRLLQVYNHNQSLVDIMKIKTNI